MKALVLFLVTFLYTPLYAETLKIGYIDTNKIVNSLPQYQLSINQITEEFEPKKKELLDLFEHIELLRTKVNTINMSENKNSLQGESSKLKLLEESFKQETEFWQKTMNNKKIALLQKIELLINTTIKELAVSENYDLILYENAAFVSNKVNITGKVIERIQKLDL